MEKFHVYQEDGVNVYEGELLVLAKGSQAGPFRQQLTA